MEADIWKHTLKGFPSLSSSQPSIDLISGYTNWVGMPYPGFIKSNGDGNFNPGCLPESRARVGATFPL